MAPRSKAAPLPSYIQAWHDFVRAEPERHGQDIKRLVKLIEKLLKRKDIWYDESAVEVFLDFASFFDTRKAGGSASSLSRLWNKSI